MYNTIDNFCAEIYIINTTLKINKVKINKIIFEGPDCSGKTTAVNLVKNILRWDSKSLHHKNGDQFERYAKEYILNSELVIDRSHFSEAVYSQLWRGGNPFSNKEFEFLNYLVQKNAIVVFVLPDFKLMKKRYLERKYEQQISLSELEKSRELFKQIMKNIDCVKYTASSFEELKKLVEKIKLKVNEK